jgi:hypothetical protein
MRNFRFKEPLVDIPSIPCVIERLYQMLVLFYQMLLGSTIAGQRRTPV